MNAFCGKVCLRGSTMISEGRHFEGEIMGELFNTYVIKKTITATYHPEGNGQCDRFLVSRLVERRLAPRRGFRGECCLKTTLHRLCRQWHGKLDACGRCWQVVNSLRNTKHRQLREVWRWWATMRDACTLCSDSRAGPWNNSSAAERHATSGT